MSVTAAQNTEKYPGLDEWAYLNADRAQYYIGIAGSHRHPDGRTLGQIFSELDEALVAIHKHGWVAFHNIREGLRAEVHGGGWSQGNKLWPRSMPALFDAVMDHFNLPVLTVFLPDIPENEPVGRILEKWNWKNCGVLPHAQSYDGIASNSTIYSYFRPQMSMVK